ncbi:MAG: cytochrome-c peroxidase [Steroidobacteraceae bacterium]
MPFAYGREFFWEGRAPSLEAQAILPFTNPSEMGSTNIKRLLDVIRGEATYVRGFRTAFNVDAADIDMTLVARALAAYERTLLSGDSPFDRYQYRADHAVLSARALRGLALFRGRARCATCHVIADENALFTDFQYHQSAIPLAPRTRSRLAELAQQVRTSQAAGETVVLNQRVSRDPDLAALGRFIVTGKPSDIGLFRTPSLRNVALTAPYMHSGSVPTLEQAVDLELYGREGSASSAIVLTEEERNDLTAFLKSLTSSALSGRTVAQRGAAAHRPLPE